MPEPTKKLIGGVAVIEHKGKHFLIRQSKNKPLSGFWRHPGGNFNEGESFEQGLKREIKEELGAEIKLVSAKPIMIAEYDYKKGSYFGFFDTKVNNTAFIIDDYEIDQFGWFTPEEAQKLDLMKATKDFYKKHGRKY
jgi:ADP-ribose pyrophosphatase YjhB (NUDIX family)